MIVILIIGILAAIGTAQYQSMIRKSADGLTKGNLGTMRSSLSIYYGDNEVMYPRDNLNCLIQNRKYLEAMPFTRILPTHVDTTLVTGETTPTETGGWSYNNDDTSTAWGLLKVGCFHQDSRSEIWSTY